MSLAFSLSPFCQPAELKNRDNPHEEVGFGVKVETTPMKRWDLGVKSRDNPHEEVGFGGQK